MLGSFVDTLVGLVGCGYCTAYGERCSHPVHTSADYTDLLTRVASLADDARRLDFIEATLDEPPPGDVGVPTEVWIDHEEGRGVQFYADGVNQGGPNLRAVIDNAAGYAVGVRFSDPVLESWAEARRQAWRARFTITDPTGA
jgi:hypothetical protein